MHISLLITVYTYVFAYVHSRMYARMYIHVSSALPPLGMCAFSALSAHAASSDGGPDCNLFATTC